MYTQPNEVLQSEHIHVTTTQIKKEIITTSSEPDLMYPVTTSLKGLSSFYCM